MPKTNEEAGAHGILKGFLSIYEPQLKHRWMSDDSLVQEFRVGRKEMELLIQAVRTVTKLGDVRKP